MDTGTARLFAQYRAWADELTYAAVAALPPGEATRERPTLFKNMIGTLNHNYLIDLVWQAHLEGRAAGRRPACREGGVGSLRARLRHGA